MCILCNWRRDVEKGELRKARSLEFHIRMDLDLVASPFEFRTGPSSKKGTSAQVILLLLGTRMPKWTSLATKMAMIAMPSVAVSRVVNVVVCIKERAE